MADGKEIFVVTNRDGDGAYTRPTLTGPGPLPLGEPILVMWAYDHSQLEVTIAAVVDGVIYSDRRTHRRYELGNEPIAVRIGSIGTVLYDAWWYARRQRRRHARQASPA